jgi:hypothetical protein
MGINDASPSVQYTLTDRASCIVWHDYGNRAYPHLTTYLDKLSESHDIFAVQETWLTFLFYNAEHLVTALKM